MVRGPAGIILQLLCYIYVFAILCIGIYKLYLFIAFFGFQISVSQVCLWLNISASISKYFSLFFYSFI